MSTAIEYFEPVPRMENIDRLALPVADSDLWDEVHTEFQNQLKFLANEVCRRVSGVHAYTGRTEGENFFLFSYVTFSLPESRVDPVVVGITLTPNQDRVTLEADISGEERGDMIYSVTKVVDSRHDVSAVAKTLAVQLSQSAEAIETALRDSHRTAY